MKTIEVQIDDLMRNDALHEQFGIDGDLLVTISLALINDANVYLYGAGTDVYTFVRMFTGYGLKVVNIIDADRKKAGRTIGGITVISPEEFISQREVKNKFVFICTYYCSGAAQMKFMEILRKADTKGFYVIGKDTRNILTTNTCDWIDANRADYYKCHVKELKCFASSLQDEKSGEVLRDYLESYMTNSMYKGEQIPTRYKYFYGNEKEELYRHLDDEVWINCGAATGDSVVSFFSWNLNAKKICAVEGSEGSYWRMRDHVSLLPKDKREKVHMFNEFIDENTDFNKILGNDQCTLINADIEGNELQMLKAIKRLIKEDRPVIAVCVYHKKEDLVEIPQFFREELQDYRFYLRKYTPWVQNLNRNHELVLYAVPNERSHSQI